MLRLREFVSSIPELAGITLDSSGVPETTFCRIWGRPTEPTWAASKSTKEGLVDGDIIQLGPTVMFRYSVTDADQQAMFEHLYDASVTDALTSAYNREYFDTRLASELAYARRHERH